MLTAPGRDPVICGCGLLTTCGVGFTGFKDGLIAGCGACCGRIACGAICGRIAGCVSCCCGRGMGCACGTGICGRGCDIIGRPTACGMGRAAGRAAAPLGGAETATVAPKRAL